MERQEQRSGDGEHPAHARLARGTSQTGLRRYNERLVLSLIRRHGALPKAEIARLTGLSAQTISVIMKQLDADRLVRREAPVRGRVVRCEPDREPHDASGLIEPGVVVMSPPPRRLGVRVVDVRSLADSTDLGDAIDARLAS